MLAYKNIIKLIPHGIFLNKIQKVAIILAINQVQMMEVFMMDQIGVYHMVGHFIIKTLVLMIIF